MNVLVAAARMHHPDHAPARRWVEATAGSGEMFALSEHVLSSTVRILINPRATPPPLTREDALEYADRLRNAPSAGIVAPSRAHWPLFTDLCRTIAAKPNDVPDAYLAALAIDTGCELVTFDRSFGRFPGLRWRTPA